MDSSEAWDEVGRAAVKSEVEAAYFDVEYAIDDITRELMEGHEPDREDVVEARVALNTLRRLLEERVAPVADCDEWGDPVPDLPAGRVWDVYYGGERPDE